MGTAVNNYPYGFSTLALYQCPSETAVGVCLCRRELGRLAFAGNPFSGSVLSSDVASRPRQVLPGGRFHWRLGWTGTGPPDRTWPGPRRQLREPPREPPRGRRPGALLRRSARSGPRRRLARLRRCNVNGGGGTKSTPGWTVSLLRYPHASIFIECSYRDVWSFHVVMFIAMRILALSG